MGLRIIPESVSEYYSRNGVAKTMAKFRMPRWQVMWLTTGHHKAAWESLLAEKQKINGYRVGGLTKKKHEARRAAAGITPAVISEFFAENGLKKTRLTLRVSMKTIMSCVTPDDAARWMLKGRPGLAARRSPDFIVKSPRRVRAGLDISRRGRKCKSYHEPRAKNGTPDTGREPSPSGGDVRDQYSSGRRQGGAPRINNVNGVETSQGIYATSMSAPALIEPDDLILDIMKLREAMSAAGNDDPTLTEIGYYILLGNQPAIQA